MMGDVMRFEARLLRADPTLRWTLIVFLAVVVYALAQGLGERAEQRASAEDLRAARDSQWLENKAQAEARELERAEAGEPLDEYASGPRSPAIVGLFYGTQVIAEPPPLTALAVGQRDLYPAAPS